MKFIVIGSGLIGVTTAYFLRDRGHDVTVIDREADAARGASFANGGLLTPSMPEPWNAPGCWRVLASSLSRSDSALQLRWRALPQLTRWGISFLRNSSVARFERSARSNLRLALYSLEILGSLRQRLGLEYGHAACGTLRLFRTPAALSRVASAAERWASEGLGFRRLSPAEVVDLEPALESLRDQLAGALHYQVDESGDARRFCESLAAEARRRGVEFRFGIDISSLNVRSNRIVEAVSPQEVFSGDQYIVAAGSYSSLLLRNIGVHTPVQPVKGYSITIEEFQSRRRLEIPVIDDDLHAAVTPLGNVIRVAGTAEFAGYDRTLTSTRIQNLKKLLKAILPELQYNPAAVKEWCGLRPVCSDGVPIIGQTPIANLLVNTGHGPLGWTMAAGSAHLLTEIISGNSPRIDPAPFSVARFGVSS